MNKLEEDALKLAILHSMKDVHTLIDWAERADDLDETIRHLEQASTLLTESVENLHDLRQRR